MDKANVRILTLALIAVLFVGQAVYDFLKKKRSQAQQRHPSHQRVKARTAKRATTPAPVENKVAIPKTTVTTPVVSAETAPPEPMTTNDETAPDHDEIRRAIIWSEILKRKF